ncbi:hydrogenase formation protein HypD [Candidatus Wirthbacteria bacterium CG2_30_54_11]|uniref:Hydrogenase formation protein HypD n=1 Tax=Candidatus Wirthbacteria bacterium CG2_30_54_11 TaxID=1817892 RepID=A0A1J5IH80_9BACT|nr:MAG: hydrogenase formation protein HypD [Candidatus Wirthbacteria bacterium CG2_30_54_11]
MKYLDEFRNAEVAKSLVDRIHAIPLTNEVKFMEVCGSHTMAISRSGIRRMLPNQVKLLSGPGCPVCVTAQEDIDIMLAFARVENVIVTTFGDMMRVPGTIGSLQVEKSNGADVRVVYSTLDALDIARANPEKRVVFLGVGFETTVPTIARSIEVAHDEDILNYSVFLRGKTIPIPMEVLASDPEIGLHGFLCPAHVSTIIGTKAYAGLVEKYHLPCVAAGFEPLDILQGVLMLLRQVSEGRAENENEYSRVATENGNPAALALMDSLFEPVDALWRGIGMIPATGLSIRSEFAQWDAEWIFAEEIKGIVEDLQIQQGSSTWQAMHKACQCGEVLKGKIIPPQCPLFAKACTPQNPVGPCMVSSEGSCAAYYRFER